MKVLFITKQLKMEPLGLMYLSAAAKKAGHEVKLIVTDQKPMYEIYDEITQYAPDIIGYSVMTGDQKFYLDLNTRLKKQIFKPFISIFGGPHPTFFPEIHWEEGVDITCAGEGEEAFVQLLDRLSLSSCKDINYNLSFIQDIRNLTINIPNLDVGPGEPLIGKVLAGQIRPFSNLDSLAPPDRLLVKAYPRVYHCPIKHFIASRGCPFSCSYCFNEKYAELYKGKGERVRYRNVDSLINEINSCVNESSFVYFQDDTFTINKKWLREFASKYPLYITLPFHCHVRANTIDEETVYLLKNAGCRSVHLAAECANDGIRNNLLKRNMTKEQIFKACEFFRDADIKIMIQNMIGLPTSSIDDELDTLEMNIQCKPDYAWVSIYQPYPGTWLGNWCKENNWYNGDFSDIGSNFFTGSVLNFTPEHKKQLTVLQKIFGSWTHDPKKYNRKFTKYILKSACSENFKDSYKKERTRGDEVLYGFKL